MGSETGQVGTLVGPVVGADVGVPVLPGVGPAEGAGEGASVGLDDGAVLGTLLGSEVGDSMSGQSVFSAQNAVSIGLQGTEKTNMACLSLFVSRSDAPHGVGIAWVISTRPLKVESRTNRDTWATPSMPHLAT